MPTTASEKTRVASKYTHQIGRIKPEGRRYDNVNPCGSSQNIARSSDTLHTDQRKSTHPVTLAVFDQELGEYHGEEQTLQRNADQPRRVTHLSAAVRTTVSIGSKSRLNGFPMPQATRTKNGMTNRLI